MFLIRSSLTAQRHALAVLGAIVALGLAVAVAHGAPGQDHMGGMADMDEPAASRSTIFGVCLGVLEVSAAGAILVGGWLLARRRPTHRPPDVGASLITTAAERRPPSPGARAGPALLQVYRL